LQRGDSSFFYAIVEARWSVVDAGAAAIALKERLSTDYTDYSGLKQRIIESNLISNCFVNLRESE
jgi:hypothetical protein